MFAGTCCRCTTGLLEDHEFATAAHVSVHVSQLRIHTFTQALIKPTRSEKHPRVMVSMDWTDLLPRSEIVRTPSLNLHCMPRRTHGGSMRMRGRLLSVPGE